MKVGSEEREVVARSRSLVIDICMSCSFGEKVTQGEWKSWISRGAVGAVAEKKLVDLDSRLGKSNHTSLSHLTNAEARQERAIPTTMGAKSN
jgi:hypothetical protein